MFSFFKVIHIILIKICFFLKSNVEIRFCPIFIFQVKNDPFYSIPDEEWQIEQFTLLSRMNKFVIEFYFVKFSKCKDKPENTTVPLKWTNCSLKSLK